MTELKKTILITSFFLFVLTAVFALIYAVQQNTLCLTLAITFGTTFYHFAMRLFVGKITKKKFNFNTMWFREKSFEKKLYRLLNVKKWKNKMPSYNPATYITKKVNLSEIVNTMCRNEVIHETIVLLSFVPILFSKLFDAAAVFTFTSVFAACFDLIFVIMQRYNRPRVIKILERQNKIKNRK